MQTHVVRIAHLKQRMLLSTLPAFPPAAPLKILLLLLCCSAGGLLKAQTFHYGIKAGLNFAANSGNGMSGSYNTGYEIGGYGVVQLNKQFSLQPELFYTQRNPQRSDDFLKYYNLDGSYIADKTMHLGYISLPVLLRYNILKYLALSAGPQYNLLVYDNENLLREGGDAFKRSDIGLAGGVDFTLDKVVFYGRYYYGLSNINNVDNRYAWKARQASIGMGFRLR